MCLKDEKNKRVSDCQTSNNKSALLSRQEQKTDAEKLNDIASGFLIKKRPNKKIVDILHDSDIKKLIEAYPEIENIKGIKVPVLFFSKDAGQGIKKHIAWGEKTDENVHEQGGLLIGKPFQVEGRIVGIVEHIIPADVICANTAYLKMGTETWVKMLEIYDKSYKEKGMYVIGWFHTHPNSLPVFMSSTDMGTQRAFFNQDWHFSVVLNPHRHLIACFNSAIANECGYYPSDFAGSWEENYGK